MNVLSSSITIFIIGFSITLIAIYFFKLVNYIMDRLIKISDSLYWAFCAGLVSVILYLFDVYLWR